MEVVTDRDKGLFPKPGEMKLACDCPDWATMCKHVAAVLYGVGSRLDDSPELLFRLRGVDEAELIAADLTLPDGAASADTLADEDLASIFGIDLDAEPAAPVPNATPPEPPAPSPDATTPRTYAPTGAEIAELRGWCGFSVAEFAGLLRKSPPRPSAAGRPRPDRSRSEPARARRSPCCGGKPAIRKP